MRLRRCLVSKSTGNQREVYRAEQSIKGRYFLDMSRIYTGDTKESTVRRLSVPKEGMNRKVARNRIIDYMDLFFTKK